MGAFRNSSRAEIPVRWDKDTAAAFHGDVEAIVLSIDFYSEEVETLPSRIKVIRLSRRV